MPQVRRFTFTPDAAPDGLTPAQAFGTEGIYAFAGNTTPTLIVEADADSGNLEGRRLTVTSAPGAATVEGTWDPVTVDAFPDGTLFQELVGDWETSQSNR